MVFEVSRWKSGREHIAQWSLIDTPHPTSVWLYYSTKAAAVAELSQSMFQRTLSDDEYAKLVDAQTGDSVRICTSHFEQPFGFFLSMIRIKLLRAIKIGTWSGTVKVEYGLSHDGCKPQLLLLNFLVPQEAQKKGLATRMLAAQVQTARTFGFESILAYAAGGSDSEAWDTRNGYYTWPRLGFDKRLTAAEKARLSPAFTHLSYLREIMEQPDGRSWWRTHGFALEVTFDISPRSYSMQRLQAALVDLHQRNAYWNSGQDMQLHIERGRALHPCLDWQQRIWEYRQL